MSKGLESPFAGAGTRDARSGGMPLARSRALLLAALLPACFAELTEINPTPAQRPADAPAGPQQPAAPAEVEPAPQQAPDPEPFPALGTATAVATFHSLGLYWKPADGAATRTCSVQFRRAGATAWRRGLDLWFDARSGEYRGSLVQLEPGTAWQVKLSLSDGASTAQLTASTWSETFPIARTIVLPASSSATLEITESGSPSGYLLYTAAPGGSTIDVANAADFNVRLANVGYVIVRGLTLKGARRDGVRIESGAHDIVIDGNDISGWGRVRDAARGWGVNGDSGVHVAYRSSGVERIVIQNNRIHSPRYTANSWADGHPAGPLGTYFENCSLPDRADCGSNHVIRYNEVVGDAAHSFMDGIGGEDNFSATGHPNADSDIYGNLVRYVWDDAIEAEGGNRNVRIWGNYLDHTFTGIATAATHLGPIYVFRNVYDVSLQRPGENDSVEHGPFAKLGDNGGFGGGRRYFFHNTLLQQPPPSGQLLTQGAGGGPQGGTGDRPMVEVVSRNNIWHILKPHWASLYGNASSRNNDVDFDLHSGTISIGGSGNRIGTNGQRAAPSYAPGHGAVSRAGGQYALAPGTPGFDGAERLPNFNDDFSGAAPDVGAHESGAPPMRFGPTALP